jgi:flagellar M-ring protein FliF
VVDFIKTSWAGSSPLAKVMFVLFLSLILVFTGLGAYWLLKDEYEVVYDDLTQQDAAAIVTELERVKVPYRLNQSGTAILLPKEEAAQIKLKLAGKGVASTNNVGFELFNNAEFGMTEFAQKINYLRALQGELERTIVTFAGVKSARVHLVLPESTLFKRKTSKTKASVSIVTKDGEDIAIEQVVGIQRLVASSVADLSPADVTVMNQQGVALNKQVMLNSEEADPYQRLEVKKQLENYFTNKLNRILDKVVGSGKAIVTTDISLNYDEVKVTKEDIVPLPNTKGQSVGAIYKQRITSQVESADKLSNFSEDQAQMPPPTSGSQEVEFANNRRIEHILSAPGAIHKISVAVVLPENTDSLTLLKVREVVAASAGINPVRGDQVIVHAISTYQSGTSQPEVSQSPDQVSELPALEQPAQSTNAIAVPATSKYAAYSWLVPILAVLLLLVLLLKWRSPQPSNKLSQTERDKLLQEINHWATGKHDGS